MRLRKGILNKNSDSETEALSCNSPGTKRNHNLLITNVLEIPSLPGDINLASPGKSLFAIMLIIIWLQIKGLPGDFHEQVSEA